MRTAKSYKFVLLLTTLVLSLLAFFVCVPKTSQVFAAKPSNASKYFSGTAQEIAFKDDSVSAKFVKGEELILNNPLAIDNLGLELKIDGAQTFKLTFTTDSYIASGNEVEEGKFDTVIKHQLTLDFNGNAIVATFNGENANATLDGNLDISFNVTDNILKATVEGQEIVNTSSAYKVKDIDLCVASNITFTVAELQDGSANATFNLYTVDQDTTDLTGAKKQSFKLTDSNEVETLALPQVAFSDVFYNYDGKINVKQFNLTTVTMNAYNIFGDIKPSNLKLVKNDQADNIWLEDVENPKSVIFKNLGEQKIDIKCALSDYSSNVLRTLSINVYAEDEEVPVYIDAYKDAEKTQPTEEYAAYLKAVEQATKVVDEEGNESFIKLGSNYTIPSLRNLVRDNYTSYDNLSMTIYYKTPKNNTTVTTGKDIPIDKAGDYSFYVVLSDSSRNAMEKEDFFTANEKDENVIEEKGIYFDFVFKFHIEDTSEFTVTAKKSQGTGYVGTLYTATVFNIDASNYSDSYKLEFNAKKDATSNDSGWVEIIQAKDLNDSYNSDVFTAEEIKSINYNGELSFMPDREGTYRITCRITSDNTARSDEAQCYITVEKTIKVTPYEPLETREIWAIVFLSVGGLCLIGIIALIFIKPKENTNAEDND